MIQNMRYTLVFLMLVVTCLVTNGCGSKSYFESVEAAESAEDGTDEDPQQAKTAKDASDTLDEKASDETESVVFVQVSGEVIHPGVYELENGSRIFEAIEAAGGITEDADIRTMNQATVVSDGDMIYVPAYGEAESEGSMTGTKSQSGITEDGKVNLNAATVEELMTLPGIGEAKARLIVDYRETNGRYEDPAEIMKIQGIKQGVYDRISDMVVTE